MIAVRSIFAVAALAALAGCASSAPLEVGLGQPERAAAPSASERLVAALLDADRAGRSEDQARLLAAIGTIDALGGRPETDADRQQLTRWRAGLSGDGIPLRGRMLGPGYRSGRLAPGQASTLEQIFVGGQSATIAIMSGGEQSLQIWVIDADEKRVCSHTARRATCRWLPLFTQRHRIELRNPGRTEAEYYLAFE